MKMAALMPELRTNGTGKPCWSENFKPDGPGIFSQWQDSGLMQDRYMHARLTEVCHYLRGNKSLNAPEGWKQVFPTVL